MRIHVLSERNSCSHLSWANNFEFEDVIASTCGATIISPRQHLAHTRWEPVTGRIRKGRYRKVEDSGDLGGDLLIVVGMGPPALRMLNAIHGWRRKYAQVVAYIPDIYPPSHRMLDLRLACQLDALFIGYSQMVTAVSDLTRVRTYHLQQAADVLVGLPRREDRKIDVSAFGRQPQGVTQALARDLTWPHSDVLTWWSQGTIPYSRTPELDRKAFLGMLRATRVTLCYRFEDTHPRQFKGVSPFTARWFEAAAAGTAIVGSQPSCPEGEDETMIETIPLSTQSEEVIDELLDLLSSGAYRPWAHSNFVKACRYHDWRHRIVSVLETLNVASPPKLQKEIELLAKVAESSPQV